MFQLPNVTELLSMIVIIHLDDKYAASHHIVDLVGMVINAQKPACSKAAYMQTLSNRATAYYNLIPTDNFYLE